MTHHHLRPRYRRALKHILAVANIWVIGTGVSIIVFPPQTFSFWQVPAATLAAALMIVGGLGGLYATITGHWRTERWVIPLSVGGMGMYAISIIQTTITASSGRSASAFVALGAVTGLVYRYFEILGRADADKKEHEALSEE